MADQHLPPGLYTQVSNAVQAARTAPVLTYIVWNDQAYRPCRFVTGLITRTDPN